MAAVAVQFALAISKASNAISSGAATLVEIVAWSVLLVVVIFGAVVLLASRGRHSETVTLSREFPGSVVVSTPVNDDRRAAIESVGWINEKVKLPLEMRVVLMPDSLSFWRRDLSEPVIQVTGVRIRYEVGEYVTLAGRFPTLKARVSRGERVVDIPFFPLETRKIWPTQLSNKDLHKIADHLNGMEGG